MGNVHCGVQSAAQHIYHDLEQMPGFQQALEDNPDLEVHVVGHSLGAATAVVLCSMLRCVPFFWPGTWPPLTCRCRW